MHGSIRGFTTAEAVFLAACERIALRWYCAYGSMVLDLLLCSGFRAERENRSTTIEENRSAARPEPAEGKAKMLADKLCSQGLSRRTECKKKKLTY
jgi:hypothetical protein